MGRGNLPTQEAAVAPVCGHPSSGTTPRGLCRKCYQQAWKAGTLINFERLRHSDEETVLEVERGFLTFWNCYDAWGIKAQSLRRALERSKRQDLVRKLGGEVEARRADDSRRAARDRDSANAERAD